MGSLSGRVAIITGAGRGIGASIAHHFAAEGASLVLNDLGAAPDGTGQDSGPAERVAAEIDPTGETVVADGGDIGDTATGQRLVDTAVERFGGLHVVVNAAGILRDRMVFNMPDEDWDAVIRVHLRGHFSTVKPAAAHWRSLRDPGGNFRIINFTSDSGLQGSPGQANYAAAKMGIIGLTGSLANALARYGVTANSIAPGAVTRLMTGTPDKELEKTLSPDNVAPLAAYLAGTQSGWLSGRTLGSIGHEVTLWNHPAILATLTSPGPWDPADLATRLEQEIRPLADGLPPSIFMDQVPG